MLCGLLKQILGEDIPGSEDQDVTRDEFDHAQVKDWDEELDEVILSDADVELAAANFVNAIVRLVKDNGVDVRKNRDAILQLATGITEGAVDVVIDQVTDEP